MLPVFLTFKGSSDNLASGAVFQFIRMVNRDQRRWLWSGLGAAVLLLVIYNLSRSPEWRAFHWQSLWASLLRANPVYLVTAIIASYATYWVRALRWKFFLDPIKKCSFWTLFVAQIVGFSSIYLIGRAGEVVRPAYVAKMENLPFTSQVAVWLLERIYDSAAMVILFAAALYIEPIHPVTARAARILSRTREGAGAVLVLSLGVIVLLVLFRLYSARLMAHTPRLLGWMSPLWRSRVEGLLQSFSTGLEVIQNFRDFAASVICTVVLWFLNGSIFWLTFRSLGGQIAQMSMWASVITMFFAALGLVIQLPGVGGGYQVATMLALRQVFRIAPEQAASGGVLIWVTVLLPCLALGVALLLYEGMTLGKLTALSGHKGAARDHAAAGKGPLPVKRPVS